MNEVMIKNWNAVVKPQDKVYHLGDVYFGNNQVASEILGRLNGHKRLIIGNHDCVYGKGNPLQMHFEKMYIMKKWPQEDIILSHIPLHESALYASHAQKDLINVCGHIHQNPAPKGPYFNICVEQPHMNYTPISLEDLRENIKKLT